MDEFEWLQRRTLADRPSSKVFLAEDYLGKGFRTGSTEIDGSRGLVALCYQVLDGYRQLMGMSWIFSYTELGSIVATICYITAMSYACQSMLYSCISPNTVTTWAVTEPRTTRA